MISAFKITRQQDVFRWGWKGEEKGLGPTAFTEVGGMAKNRRDEIHSELATARSGSKLKKSSRKFSDGYKQRWSSATAGENNVKREKCINFIQ